jgi:hypothetical protein
MTHFARDSYRIVAIFCVLLALTMSTACGNSVSTEVVGGVAISRDGDSGRAVIHVVVCRGGVGQVEMYEVRGPSDPEPSTDQEPIATWTRSRDSPTVTSFMMDKPSAGWHVKGQPNRFFDLKKAQFEGGSNKQDQALSGLTVSLAEFRTLEGDESISSFGRSNVSDLKKLICSRIKS